LRRIEEAHGVINGLLIGLREGVEASLVVGIVVAYLVRTGNREHLPKVWAGTVAAVAVAVLLGLALYVAFGTLGSPWEQIFEGTTMLLATAIVTWMLFWMRGQARAMRGHLEAQLAKALGEGGAWGLAVLAFTSVIREGIECSLFVFGQITAVTGSQGDGGAQGVLAGTVVGLLIAAGIGYAVYRGSRRIDLRAFFTWTGIALVFIAAGLVSRAVHEFVEVGVIGVGTQTAFNVSGVLSQDQGPGSLLRAVFGYTSQPEIVTLVVYLVYVVAVIALYVTPQRSGRPAPSRAS
jgi:high-affinity iron transporter